MQIEKHTCARVCAWVCEQERVKEREREREREREKRMKKYIFFMLYTYSIIVAICMQIVLFYYSVFKLFIFYLYIKIN
jgi:cell division septal protein FtsQ